MSEQNQSMEAKIAAPYTSFQSVKTLLQGFKEHGVPGRIDRSVMTNFSGAVGGQVITALRFFKMIDHNSHPTESMTKMVAALGTDDWPATLEVLVRQAYEPLFELNLETATPNQFNERFRASYAGTDEVLRKSVTFFVNAAREAGIKISPYIMKNKKPRSASTKRRSPKTNGQDVGPNEAPSNPHHNPPPARHQHAEAPEHVLLKLLNPNEMSDEEQAAIWTLLKYLKMQEMKNSGDGHP